MGSPMSAVRSITVSRAVVNEVHNHLHAVGREGLEGVGFWAGSLRETVFEVDVAYVPKQLSGRMGGGVLVLISGDELFRMNTWLHRSGKTIIAQLHSHPGSAYHSDTDDEFAVITQSGALSIVVPDYAKEAFDLRRLAVYRLSTSGKWQQLPANDVEGLITIY